MTDIEKLGKLFAYGVGVLFLIFFRENQTFEWVIFIGVFLLVGIPHGSLDHLIYQERQVPGNLFGFFLRYILVILLYLVLWFLFPVFSLLIFLIISAYHFGQTHFLQQENNSLSPLLFLSLGGFYLSLILWSDFENTQAILSEIVNITEWFQAGKLMVVSFFLATSILLLIDFSMKKISLVVEMLVLGTLLYSLPLLLSFVVYFGFWHSLPSLKTQFESLTAHMTKGRIKWFVQRVLPLTAISVLGIFLVVFISSDWLSEGERILLFFTLISLISAPHIWVMDRFIKSRNRA
ncbi:Brp/Blh family beta-carotene 15,15'-dioxygenase [Pleomorphovibrio marinus]|uniref:Brp/Blh family beta-carotene 15,15'-dioxygenase n=1 Tax=Pleomorphovibrio marinus TaxID=2164132 RepID=UPI0013001758|nr:Brp/Blh family beta-carotene 15,15'-dioxygenase [Pleomorphovibrio marinus]